MSRGGEPGGGDDLHRVHVEQAAVRRHEQEFRAIFELAGVGKAQVDPDTSRFVRVNRKLCDITGYPADELLRKTVAEVTHPDDCELDRAIFARVLRGESEGWESEKRYVRKDGAVIWVHVTGTLVRDVDGRPLHTHAVILDITERKRLEAELRQRMDELASADRQKDEFLAVLAHELRNPLGPILHAVRALDRFGPPDDRAARQRAIITRQALHMARLLDDLLDLSRIEHGKIELRREPLDLRAVVEQAVDSCRSLLDERGHALSVALPEGPLPVDADPTRLEQILWNLLSNAAKYTPPGGSVAIAAERAGERAVVRVRDTGEGIPEEMLDRIFDLFTQVGRPGERARGGLGIGLTLVRRLVALHGGTVEAHSAGTGRGTELVVSLPLLPAPRSASRRPPEPAPGARHPLRVLVVEDNLDAAETLCDLLDLVGHTATAAHSGPEALDLADRFRPDVVLLDIGLPGMDGYEAARLLRDRPTGRAAALVALTGFGQEDDRRRAREAGFDHHLTKPVDPNTLEALLARLGGARSG